MIINKVQPSISVVTGGGPVPFEGESLKFAWIVLKENLDGYQVLVPQPVHN